MVVKTAVSMMPRVTAGFLSVRGSANRLVYYHGENLGHCSGRLNTAFGS